jgi:carbon storage regulator CsrA
MPTIAINHREFNHAGFVQETGRLDRDGDCISITVTRITGGRVRLGITAQKHITVNRGEVYRRIGTDHDRNTSLVAMSR